MAVRPFVTALLVVLGVDAALVAAPRPQTERARVQAAVPRTPDGHPDLQGLWDYRTATPLERPRDLPDKAFFTDQEAADFEKRTAERRDNVVAVHPPAWLDYGSRVLADRRTSLIVDPPNGRDPGVDGGGEGQGRGDEPRQRTGRRWSGTTQHSGTLPACLARDRRWCRVRTTTTSRSCRHRTPSSS